MKKKERFKERVFKADFEGGFDFDDCQACVTQCMADKNGRMPTPKELEEEMRRLDALKKNKIAKKRRSDFRYQFPVSFDHLDIFGYN
ncbi:MAG: hypothetical protein KIH62_002945 [Candidatus Kerfeldbacteria bacterium]|nr:hypothetical protein [Candidatus Kerfeldbacteria bacterium]